MRGEKESTRTTFAAKLAVSGKERTWITDDKRATGPSNIHAFDVLSGSFLACRGIVLRYRWLTHARMKALEMKGQYRSPATAESINKRKASTVSHLL